MRQLSFFDEINIQEIRREVLLEFPRIPGESYDEWRELIRIEVDYRIKEFRKNKPHPNYKPQLINK